MIERIFSALKKCFKVLLFTQEYSFGTQAQIISAMALLHNFIVIYDPSEISATKVKGELSTDDTWS
jgi:hypothetical protein